MIATMNKAKKMLLIVSTIIFADANAIIDGFFIHNASSKKVNYTPRVKGNRAITNSLGPSALFSWSENAPLESVAFSLGFFKGVQIKIRQELIHDPDKYYVVMGIIDKTPNTIDVIVDYLRADEWAIWLAHMESSRDHGWSAELIRQVKEMAEKRRRKPAIPEQAEQPHVAEAPTPPIDSLVLYNANVPIVYVRLVDKDREISDGKPLSPSQILEEQSLWQIPVRPGSSPYILEIQVGNTLYSWIIDSVGKGYGDEFALILMPGRWEQELQLRLMENIKAIFVPIWNIYTFPETKSLTEK